VSLPILNVLVAGHAGGKTLLQRNPPVPNCGYQLTQIYL